MLNGFLFGQAESIDAFIDLQMQKRKIPGLQLAMDMVRIKKLSSMLPEATVIFSFPPSLQTAAGMSSTATEIAEWIIGLQSLQILKLRSSLDALWSPAILNNGSTCGFNRLLNGYAAGWPVIKRPITLWWLLGGGRSALFIYPEDDLTIIVLTNLAGGSPDVFIDEITRFYLPDMKKLN